MQVATENAAVTLLPLDRTGEGYFPPVPPEELVEFPPPISEFGQSQTATDKDTVYAIYTAEEALTAAAKGWAVNAYILVNDMRPDPHGVIPIPMSPVGRTFVRFVKAERTPLHWVFTVNCLNSTDPSEPVKFSDSYFRAGLVHGHAILPKVVQFKPPVFATTTPEPVVTTPEPVVTTPAPEPETESNEPLKKKKKVH